MRIIAEEAIDVFKEDGSIYYAGQSVNFDWLNFARDKYNISSNKKDYLIVPIMVTIGDLPNRNFQGFLTEDLIDFSIDHGCQRYKTFIGKGTYIDHHNEDPLQAKGVILDSILQRWKRDLAKITVLTAWDRTKDPQLCDDIINKKRTNYSLGANAEYMQCSICKKNISKVTCQHIDYINIGDNIALKGGKIVNGELAWCVARYPVFFETSNVGDGAYVFAEEDEYMIQY